MRLLISCILILSILVNFISGHAVLVAPTPFSTNPSKTKLCGGGTKQTVAQITWCPNSSKTNRATWKIVVGDGAGAVTFKLATNGGTTEGDFTTTLTSKVLSGSDPKEVGTYYMDVRVPTGTTCTGTNGICTLQAYTESSGWYSCSAIKLDSSACDKAAEETALVEYNVQVKDNVKFCDQVVNKVVLLPAGTQLGEYDQRTQGVFKNNMANPLVIGQNSSQCGNLYEKVLCDVSFPLAPGSDGKPIYQVTQKQCEDFIEVCDVVSHVELYPCSIYGDGNGSNLIIIPTLLIISILSLILMF
ncbi:hypothetical protein DDB_G0281067 [Dictyostelium discoideum AX4]|uniref:Uncharacterized transmembrane protein DDB_G0281067 n=1 Tax=Dictyostelium discoideum TaxID=44689 RepID=Y3989_DICDI|nr:hypothetical protein DDB_G0281067 [Dictyostelium discoideum AX4]Q54UI0.1 RecName: Full=Uncharacterized transmembrane protein DDB_G0281067; Flags: Precursor [Dictyostelium discoideum]EAL66830.1 hypothetical protein DDB_G0281067 [Dictyostelium discoideum AX4]|eukprot:XP_640796.1 hypothetical protein DDB_G0281067 [Dictyostelium discoideum AX4]